MEGHGDHWGCLGESKGAISHFLPLACGDDADLVGKGPDIPVFDPETGESRSENIISLAAPRTDLRALALMVSNRKDKAYNIWSAYPFAQRGIRHWVRIDEIEVWKNGVEARIAGEVLDGAPIGFFDTLYHLNRHRYRIGETYEFVLAGLAYQLEVTVPEPLRLTDPQVIARYQKDLAKFGEEMPLTDDGAIEFRLDGAAIFLPTGGWDIDDYDFQAPVREVGSFDLEGQTIHVVRATTMVVDERSFDLPIYAPTHVLKGTPPKPGTDVKGRLWLQGYLAEGHNPHG